jgi:hypothetical protein
MKYVLVVTEHRPRCLNSKKTLLIPTPDIRIAKHNITFPAANLPKMNGWLFHWKFLVGPQLEQI